MATVCSGSYNHSSQAATAGSLHPAPNTASCSTQRPAFSLPVFFGLHYCPLVTLTPSNNYTPSWAIHSNPSSLLWCYGWVLNVFTCVFWTTADLLHQYILHLFCGGLTNCQSGSVWLCCLAKFSASVPIIYRILYWNETCIWPPDTKLRQSNQSVAEYALKFHILTADCGWDDTAHFWGLADYIKDELAIRDTQPLTVSPSIPPSHQSHAPASLEPKPMHQIQLKSTLIHQGIATC